MWTRAELKERAKIAFRRNYWKCVLVAFVLSLFTSAGSSISSNLTNSDDTSYDSSYEYFGDEYEDDYYEYDGYYEEEDSIIDGFMDNAGIIDSIAIVAGTVIVLVLIIIAAILSIFIFAPLEVGGCRFFIENSYDTPSAKKLLFPFRKGTYWKTVGTLFLRSLYIGLWTLLLIVPGIIKSYEYRMVPYLLADDPNMPRSDAFRISKEMMAGEKMNAFVLDLSFIGWTLLATITCGIAGIFYVTPYMQATNAELFLTLRNNYFHRQQFQNQGF